MPNDGQMTSQQAVQSSSEEESDGQMESVHKVIRGTRTSEELGLHSQYHTRVANCDCVSAKHYSSQYINVIHLNFIMFVFEFLFSCLSCLERIRALTMNVYIQFYVKRI